MINRDPLVFESSLLGIPSSFFLILAPGHVTYAETNNTNNGVQFIPFLSQFALYDHLDGRFPLRIQQEHLEEILSHSYTDRLLSSRIYKPFIMAYQSIKCVTLPWMFLCSHSKFEISRFSINMRFSLSNEYLFISILCTTLHFHLQTI